MICPCCGKNELIHATRDIPYIYKGESTIIPAVTGDYCPGCGEIILNRKEGDRYSDLIGQFCRQVNASLVDPGFIVTVRKKLGINQKQATNIFGGGVNAFSRYEKGQTKPSVALIKLLKLLDLHPELFKEVELL
jgi:HTH-type transcriptional regulator / antitoxin MqsA